MYSIVQHIHCYMHTSCIYMYIICVHYVYTYIYIYTLFLLLKEIIPGFNRCDSHVFILPHLAFTVEALKASRLSADLAASGASFFVVNKVNHHENSVIYGYLWNVPNDIILMYIKTHIYIYIYILYTLIPQ